MGEFSLLLHAFFDNDRRLVERVVDVWQHLVDLTVPYPRCDQWRQRTLLSVSQYSQERRLEVYKRIFFPRIISPFRNYIRHGFVIMNRLMVGSLWHKTHFSGCRWKPLMQTNLYLSVRSLWYVVRPTTICCTLCVWEPRSWIVLQRHYDSDRDCKA